MKSNQEMHESRSDALGKGPCKKFLLSGYGAVGGVKGGIRGGFPLDCESSGSKALRYHLQPYVSSTKYIYTNTSTHHFNPIHLQPLGK